ncbi:N-6 DNA methylase [Phytohabitans aurantiacus]|uniref:Type II restriction endonuclease subunit M n=1 Tax=Phytohabitans aurantiacus TaxID=3016789 RepID=A0ABQ5QZS5_9ACTN|nr:N-6 DNA methylase [Phytohabitans aurantiacus]GLH99800.1 type II restriction endonuclease subunit M [Phytohabitans aurantiacus]
MPSPPALVTAAEISRLAGVTRATVSNWRRRHLDFPAPAGGTDSSPAYDLDAVRAWLDARGLLPTGAAVDDLRAALRARPDSSTESLLALVVAAHRLDRSALDDLATLPDHDLATRAATLAPSPGAVPRGADEAVLLRALLRCVQKDGPVVATDVLAEHGADERTTGNYRTPAPVAELMASLLGRPRAYPSDVYDPACGVGTLLDAALRLGARRAYGQDLNPGQAAQAAARLDIAAGPETTDIRAGDSLRADAFTTLTTAAALCNPPYGNRDWGHDELAYDPRWAYGLPPKGEPELAWVQHCLAHIAPGGYAVLLMPPAAAERPPGRRLRAELIRGGALRAVIALPAGAAPPAHVGLHLWLLTRPAPGADPPETVLLVDAARRKVDGWDAVRDTASTAWWDYNDGTFAAVPSLTRAVPVIDLLAGPVDLTPARHVQSAPTAVRPADHARAVRRTRADLRRAANALAEAAADDAPWSPAGDQPQTWRTTTVADLLRGGALTMRRAVPASGATPVDIQPGDILLPELFAGSYEARVAGADEGGTALGRQRLALRPDPERLDPWFLAGFLSAQENVSAATSGSSVVRVDVRRLRVPIMALPEQRQYGLAFRRVHDLRAVAETTSRLAEDVAHSLAAGLTTGLLLPSEPPQPQTRK